MPSEPASWGWTPAVAHTSGVGPGDASGGPPERVEVGARP